MSRKSLLIITAVFVAVVSFYFLFDQVYLPRKEKQSEKETKVFTLEREDLDLIKIDTQNKKIILVKEKDKDRWVMTAPFETQTDAGEVESFIALALDAEMKRKLGTKDELKESLDDFGLDKPALTVLLGAGDTSEALLIGTSAPSGDEFYAMRKGDDQIFLVDSLVFDDLNKDTTTLRDKTLFAFSPDDIASFSVVRDNKTVTVKKDTGGSWLITEPVAFAADSDQITDILDFVTDASAVSFAEEGADPRAYGLDRPAIDVTLIDKDGAISRLFIGKSDGSDNYWAMREGQPWIFTVSEKLKNKLTISADFIMNRSLFAYTVSDVSSFELTTDDGSISAERKNGLWKITKPETTTGDKDAINSLLFDLKEMKFSEIVRKPAGSLGTYGLDKPTLVFSVTLKTGGAEHTDELRLARGAGTTSYGYLSAGDIIFSIPTETIAELKPTLFSLKDKSLLSFTADDIEKVTIDLGEKTYAFKRKGDDWKMTEPVKRTIDAEIMEDLFGTIGDLSYFETAAKKKDKPADWGLDKPEITIKLLGKDKKEIGTIDLGKEKEDESGTYIPAVSSSKEEVYKVDPDQVDGVKNDITLIEEER